MKDEKTGHWYQISSIFTKDKAGVMPLEGEELPYVKGHYDDILIIRFDDDVYEGKSLEEMQSLYQQFIDGMDEIGGRKASVLFMPPCVDACRLVPCDETTAAGLEAALVQTQSAGEPN